MQERAWAVWHNKNCGGTFFRPVRMAALENPRKCLSLSLQHTSDLCSGVSLVSARAADGAVVMHGQSEGEECMLGKRSHIWRGAVSR